MNNNEEIVKKTDWQIIDMPEQVKHFVVEKEFSAEDMELIKKGYKPQYMEQKWFMYYEDGKLFCHRSWSGYCIYIMDFSEKGKIKITANRNPEQELGDARVFGDKNIIHMLLGTLLKKDVEMYLVGGSGGVVDGLPKDVEGEKRKEKKEFSSGEGKSLDTKKEESIWKIFRLHMFFQKRNQNILMNV